MQNVHCTMTQNVAAVVCTCIYHGYIYRQRHACLNVAWFVLKLKRDFINDMTCIQYIILPKRNLQKCVILFHNRNCHVYTRAKDGRCVHYGYYYQRCTMTTFTRTWKTAVFLSVFHTRFGDETVHFFLVAIIKVLVSCCVYVWRALITCRRPKSLSNASTYIGSYHHAADMIIATTTISPPYLR